MLHSFSPVSSLRSVMVSALLIVVLFVGLLALPACSSPTPTRPPAQPTFTPPPTTVPIVPTLAPRLEPTLVVPTEVPTTSIPPPILATAVPTLTVRLATKASSQPTARPAALSGKVAYSVVTDPAPLLHRIWVANVDGSGASKILDYAGWPSFSPNGKQLAFYQLPGGGKNEGLYVADAFGGNPVAAFISPGVCCIEWSRDGNWIAFTNSSRPTWSASGNLNPPGGPILMVKADGFFKTVVDLKVIGSAPAFSADSRQFAYAGCLPGTNTCGVMVAPANGTGTLRQVTRDNGGNPQWSPRGDRIVYQAADDAGHIQVFVVNVDGSGKKQLTFGKSNDGQPAWSRDGSSIMWRSDQNGTSWAIYAMNADGSGARRILSNVPPDPSLWGWESLSIAP